MFDVNVNIDGLVTELEKFVKDLEELFKTDLPEPRSEHDLWDAEVEKLKAIRKRLSEVEKQLADIVGDENVEFWVAVFSSNNYFNKYLRKSDDEQVLLTLEIITLREAEKEILFNQPGVIPEIIYQLKDIVERFNTIEQPLIEDFIEKAEDNMGEFYEIQGELKKLFVTVGWRERDPLTLSVKDRDYLSRLEQEKRIHDDLIEKNERVLDEIGNRLKQAQPSSIEDKFELLESATVAKALKTSSTMPISETIKSFIKTDDFKGFLAAYNTTKAQLKLFERERFKISKEIFTLQWNKVEEPGLIPKTLEEAHLTINRFRTEEQPRIEKILDDVDITVQESQKVLSNANKSMENAQGILSGGQEIFEGISKYNTLIIIGIGLFGIVIFAILLILLIYLIKITF